jgi:hypothetical protein
MNGDMQLSFDSGHLISKGWPFIRMPGYGAMFTGRMIKWSQMKRLGGDHSIPGANILTRRECSSHVRSESDLAIPVLEWSSIGNDIS